MHEMYKIAVHAKIWRRRRIFYLVIILFQ